MTMHTYPLNDDDFDEVKFLAARLRRLFAHFNVAVPDGGDDARLIGNAAAGIGLLLTAQPAGVAPTRTPQDYAIEHAEYMAQQAEALLSAINARDAAYAVIEEIETDRTPTVDEREEYVRTIVAQNEQATGLRECIYEFRKRRDRAATSGVLAVAPLAWERRQGLRCRDGWSWSTWQQCTEAEAQRVTGLHSWQVRQTGKCPACAGTGRVPYGVLEVDGEPLSPAHADGSKDQP